MSRHDAAYDRNHLVSKQAGGMVAPLKHQVEVFRNGEQVTPADQPHAAPAAPKLLLVDDNHTFAQVVARALARRGFEVVVAHDVTSALGHVDRNIDYAIIDLRLGDATGLDLLGPLKKTNPSIRILLLSGYANAVTVAEAIRLGAACYLAKPVDADTMVAALMNDVAALDNPG